MGVIVCVLIAERLSMRQLILLRVSFCVCMYACMSVMFRNANFLYVTCTGSTARARGCTIVVSWAQYTRVLEYDGSIRTTRTMDDRHYQR